jgi:hypothetical protein
MNAMINSCIKPAASTAPLATDEIKKLYHCSYYLQLDGSQAFWNIPLTEDSRKLLAFQAHGGVFAWDRLTMGAQPSSSMQQGAYHDALAEDIPAEYRQSFALMADDIAAEAGPLEELFDLYKILIECLAAAGIQVKPQKLKFRIKELKFHNYKTSKERTATEEENLEPIGQMGTPTSVAEVKACLPRLLRPDEQLLPSPRSGSGAATSANPKAHGLPKAVARRHRLRHRLPQAQSNDAWQSPVRLEQGLV